MKIKDLKQPYKALALVRQKEQGNEPNEEAPLSGDGCAFRWADTKEDWDWWKQIELGNYPPIPPDSLKDIPLQVRWDSGERFKFKTDSSLVTELHSFKMGRISVCYSDGEGGIFDFNTENSFFEYCEPIPSEPQTRWVNVFIDRVTTITDNKDAGATMSFQQQLINSKWVNV